MKWTGHVPHIAETRNTYRILDGKIFSRLDKEVKLKDVDWIWLRIADGTSYFENRREN